MKVFLTLVVAMVVAQDVTGRHVRFIDMDGGTHGRHRGRHGCRGGICPPPPPQRDAGSRHRLSLDLTDMLDAARPWFQGEFQLGPFVDWEWDLLGQEEQGNWWEGPNVCSSVEEKEEEAEEGDIQNHGMMSSLSCDQTDTHYKCVHSITMSGSKKTITNKFECCHGFERLGDSSGCRTELHLTGLRETMDGLGLDDTVRGIDSVALSPRLAAGNFTVFAPIDGSFDVPDAGAMEDEAIDSNVIMLYPDSHDLVDSVRDMLSAHIVDGFYKSGDLEDEQILQTVSPAGSTIRINRYQSPKRLVTANCVPVETSDHLATNGVVHVVKKLLPPVTQNIYQLIVTDPQFTILKTMLARADFGRELEAEGTFTLFAPSDAAFRKLGAQRLERLQQSGQCLKNILKTHLLPHTICSSVIEGRARTRNLMRDYLHVSRSDSKMFVENAQITARDIMATNGVLHVIDEAILPDSALNIVEILEKNDHTQFLQLVEAADMKKALAGLENVTLLLPSRQAIENLDDETVSDLLADPEQLREVLKYHVVTDGQLRSGSIYNGRELNTLNSSKTIAVQQYCSFPFSRTNVLTAQCARVTETVNIDSCNAIAHVIDRVMIPPAGDVIDILSLHPEFSVFVGLVKESDLVEQLQLTGPFTVFAPTNEYMEEVDLDELRNDEAALEFFIKSHILPEMLCCGGVFRGSFGKSPIEHMLAGNDVVIRRGRSNNVEIDGHMIESCDMTATNGVVHALAGTLGNAEDESREDIRSIFDSIFEDFEIDANIREVLPKINFREPERTEDNDWPWWMRRLDTVRRFR